MTPLSTKEIREMTGKDLAELIVNWMNCNMANTAPKDFMVAFSTSHRTLQQNVISFFWSVLLKYETCTGGCDARNEDSVILSRKLNELVSANTLPFGLPHI